VWELIYQDNRIIYLTEPERVSSSQSPTAAGVWRSKRRSLGMSVNHQAPHERGLAGRSPLSFVKQIRTDSPPCRIRYRWRLPLLEEFQQPTSWVVPRQVDGDRSRRRSISGPHIDVTACIY
jgi:hypothetical protein